MNRPTSQRWQIALGVASFLALTLLVAVRALREVDRSIDIAVTSLPLDRLSGLFRLVSILGNIEVSGLFALVLAAALARGRGIRGLVPLLILVGILGEIVLKFAVPQLLPPSDDPSQLLRPDEAFVPRKAGELYAFPSGNVLRITFLALVVADRVPRLRGALVALLPVAAVAQVYALAHWPSDVAGGLLIGWLLSAVAGKIYSGGHSSELKDPPDTLTR